MENRLEQCVNNVVFEMAGESFINKVAFFLEASDRLKKEVQKLEIAEEEKIGNTADHQNYVSNLNKARNLLKKV